MRFKITPEYALLSIKIWLQIIICWPAPQNASKKHLIFRNIAWCVAAFIPGHLIPTSFLHSWMGPRDAAQLTKNMAECLALFVTFVKMIIYKFQESRIQVALMNAEKFLKTAGPRERELMDSYIDRYGKLYASVEVLCFVAAVAFASGPLILPQPLPGHAEYPFEWKDKPKLVAFLYATHIIATFQICAAVVLDIQFAFLLLVSGVQFELLAECFNNAHSSKEFNECVEKHQQLIASVDEIIITVRYFALNVIFNTGITNVCAGYQFVSHQPIEVMLQFALLFLITSLEVAMYAWPADNLLAVSENISHAVYSSPWFGESREVTDGIQIVMLRSQKPLAIAITGLLPTMNLDFYGKFLTTSFSYFTTLRAVVG